MTDRHRGVIQIWKYNQRFYLLSLTAFAGASLAAFWMPVILRVLLLAGALAGFLWTVVSLAVSHYVYDRSPLYDFGWLRAPRSWLTIHSGLDETSALLRARFPGASGRVFDMYDPVVMSEPSIAKARELTVNPPAERVDWRALPARDGEFDTVFLIFAAHELRQRRAREELFLEAARVLDKGGLLVVMEHLRDLPNFLAFGPGFLHFWPRSEWMHAARTAGLQSASELKVTPFVSVFTFRR
jgi:SAM-dependent methyltransferase